MLTGSHDKKGGEFFTRHMVWLNFVVYVTHCEALLGLASAKGHSKYLQ